jgi:hypothetical protein
LINGCAAGLHHAILHKACGALHENIINAPSPHPAPPETKTLNETLRSIMTEDCFMFLSLLIIEGELSLHVMPMAKLGTAAKPTLL